MRRWQAPASWRRALGALGRRRRGRPRSYPAAADPVNEHIHHLKRISKYFYTCWPPIASGTLPGKLLCEDSGEAAGLCADAAELSPQEGERLEPDPVEPGEVAGAPVS